MKEYQEALNYLDWHCNVEHKEQQDLLQELVDKEIPMKPVEALYSFISHTCPSCTDGDVIVENYYRLARCTNCGQRIDWSKDNE